METRGGLSTHSVVKLIAGLHLYLLFFTTNVSIYRINLAQTAVYFSMNYTLMGTLYIHTGYCTHLLYTYTFEYEARFFVVVIYGNECGTEKIITFEFLHNFRCFY